MHLFPFYFITNWHYPQDNQWKYCFIVVLEDNHETNCHFISVGNIEWKILYKKLLNLLVRNHTLADLLYVSETKPFLKPDIGCKKQLVLHRVY